VEQKFSLLFSKLFYSLVFERKKDYLFIYLLAEMPGIARMEISKWSVPHHTISSLIVLLRSFTRHRFRWSSSSKHDAFLKYGKQAKKYTLGTDPPKKYHLGTDPKENTTPLLSLPIRN
jgi:hypothetical protein